MKRAFISIPLIASIHLAITWYALCEAMEHGLGRGIESVFAKASPDAWFDKFVALMSGILLLPVGIVFRWLPQTTGNDIFNGILFWTPMVLNSVVWGTAIYFTARRFNTFIRHRRART